jgi:dihydrofolate reductase
MGSKKSTPVRAAIAAMTRDNVIGINGVIPWHYSEDMKRFKQRTLNNTIVMGRLTWESINCRSLPNRRNVVISRNQITGTDHFFDVESALEALDDDNVWIIGGGQIYRESLSWVTMLDITYVPDIIDIPEAVTFPRIDPEFWQASESTRLPDSPLENVIYHRR